MSSSTEIAPIRRLTAQTLETRRRILKAALALFNRDGYFAVTTHHIAAEAGMSPGNLYYHFANKDRIVHELIGEMELLQEDAWLERGPQSPRGSFVDFMRFFFGEVHKYKFFFRDFGTILRSTPAVEKMWVHQFQKLRRVMRQAALRWVELGILKKFMSEAELDSFIDTVFILLNFSGVHFELSDASSPRSREVNTLVHFLRPYHTPKGQAALDLYLQ